MSHFLHSRHALAQAEPKTSGVTGILGPILIIGFAFWIFKAYKPKARRR